MMMKLQQSRSKRIRNITEEGDKNGHTEHEQIESDETWKRKHKTNEQIRTENGIPTIESEIYGE